MTQIITGLRVVAEYQRMGDGDSAVWMEEILDQAMRRDEISNFKVLGSYTGDWGLDLVIFTVDFDFGDDPEVSAFTKTERLTSDIVKSRATDYLDATIGDTDVDVRWVSPITVEVAS